MLKEVKNNLVLPIKADFSSKLADSIVEEKKRIKELETEINTYPQDSSAYRRYSESIAKSHGMLVAFEGYQQNPERYLQQLQKIHALYVLLISKDVEDWDAALVLTAGNPDVVGVVKTYRNILDKSTGWAYDLESDLDHLRPKLSKEALQSLGEASFDISFEDFKLVVTAFINENKNGETVGAAVEKDTIEGLYLLIRSMYFLLLGYEKLIESVSQVESPEKDAKRVKEWAASKGKEQDYRYMALLMLYEKYRALVAPLTVLFDTVFQQEWAQDIAQAAEFTVLELEEMSKASQTG